MDLVRMRISAAAFLAVSLAVTTLPAQDWTEPTEADFKLSASSGAEDDRLGTSVSISGNVAIVGARGGDDGAGSTWVYRFDRDRGEWTEEQELNASDGSDGDYFGIAVAVDGDLAIVGASRDDDGGTQSGAAYVFRFDADDEEWVEEQKLTASDAAAFDWFGFAVALSDGLAVLGSVYDDNGGDGNAGAAYIFRYDADEVEWVEEQKLMASDGDTEDRFGVAVSISEGTVVVSADRNDADATDSGAAYVFGFDSDEDEWTEEQKLTPSDGKADQQFGAAVSVHGDFALIGARQDDDNGSESGSAYVFEYDSDRDEWVEAQKLVASDGAARDWFGRHVAAGDGVMVVAAPGDNDDGYGNGSAYVFRVDGAREWIETRKLVPAEEEESNQFGSSVATSGTRVLVGDPGDDDDGFASGSAYVFALGSTFLRGDVDGDGIVSVFLDSLYLMQWSFTGGDEPPCRDAADVDDDGVISALLDSLYLMQFGFTGGDAPAPPGIETCGDDPTEDDLDCAVPADSCL